MNWNEYQQGSQWAIEAARSGVDSDYILFLMSQMGTESDWTKGAHAILSDRDLSPLLSVVDAARVIGCPRDTISKAIKAGNLKASKGVRNYVIHPSDLESWDKSENRKRRKKP